jgi:ABC-2 type transport system ATP-binding protein
MSANPYIVDLNSVDKTFSTHHFFQRDDDDQKRHFYKRKQVHAANNITFGIKPGEVFGLLGPNGAGKTTTVKMVSGLVLPDAGVVSVDGLDVGRWRKRILRKVGVLLEGTRTSIWPLTPLENLSYYGNLKNVRGKILRSRAHELLEFVGLKEKKGVQVRYLSRGQKQKLALCIALIADPQVLLLDEPTTGLDVQSSRAIKDKILQMTREQGKSVLVTTHDMHVAQELCDRIGIINHGELISCRPTQELLDLFSDHTYAFHLDSAPEATPIRALHGVRDAQVEQESSEFHLIVRLEPDIAVRSEALYAIIDTLRNQGRELRGVHQRKSSLEDVFLELTKGKGTEATTSALE